MKNSLIIFFLFLIYSCNSQDKQNKNSKVEISDYKKPIDSYVIDSTLLDLKNKELKVIVLEKNKNRKKEISEHNSLPILVLEKKNDVYLKVLSNNKIVFAYNDNCPADGYQGVISKKNYFTVEQTYCLDFMYVYSYTTFFVNQDSGEISLHKFGEEYTDRSNPNKKIAPKIWTKKDFGVVKFEDITEEFLKGLRKNNPIK